MHLMKKCLLLLALALLPSPTLGGTVLSGDSNKAEGGYSVVSGGYGNTAKGGAVVSGGFQNTASGIYSFVPGGFNNVASGAYSGAMGVNTLVGHRESFVANMLGGDGVVESTKENQVTFAAEEFVIQIGTAGSGGAKAKINSGNIERFAQLLNSSDPSEVCKNSPKKFKIVTGGNLKGQKKNCQWVKKSDTGRCDLNVKDGKKTKKFSEVCPKGCGECGARSRALMEETDEPNNKASAGVAINDGMDDCKSIILSLKEEVSKLHEHNAVQEKHNEETMMKLHEHNEAQEETMMKLHEHNKETMMKLHGLFFFVCSAVAVSLLLICRRVVVH